MTNQEFSDGFTTLLNSYNTLAQFGEQASQAEITLDEYEKSVFLTQAQDMIVKLYFDIRTDEVLEGFDGSERRQVDFSSLIQVKILNEVAGISQNVNIQDISNGYLGIIKFTLKPSSGHSIFNDKSRFIISISLVTDPSDAIMHVTLENEYDYNIDLKIDIAELETIGSGYANINALANYWNSRQIDGGEVAEDLLAYFWGDLNDYIQASIVYNTGNVFSDNVLEIKTTELYNVSTQDTFDDRGILFQLPLDLLFMLNEKFEVTNGSVKKKYVVIPINYREYDRENSKPYSQPYKKQCWRLFQNILGFDALSEIIPVWDAVNSGSVKEYKIRYVRRPQPIVLVDLPDLLDIDGVKVETPCELNKILHMDILNKAFELATATRGGTPGATLARRRRNNSDNED